ncbi:jg11103 [Pararge aegeria aegeria]|uniref:Jg11103 protein n=1 Tax=Pararge aegeria aegeria TaxID=348720 RepID=A0A8S4SCQ8_9NEOP|nr:jg11103 [Pararge aegeria aegeria]
MENKFCRVVTADENTAVTTALFPGVLYEMSKILFILFSVVIASVLSAEIPSHVTLDKQDNLKPDVSEAIETHAIYKKPLKPELEHHPVYRAEELKSQGRARIEPVRSHGPVVKHDMLADEPASDPAVDKADNYGFSNPVEVAYPDIPYAPGYGYGNGFTGPNGYDLYNPIDYYMEPDTSTAGLLWSQVPDSRHHFQRCRTDPRGDEIVDNSREIGENRQSCRLCEDGHK